MCNFKIAIENILNKIRPLQKMFNVSKLNKKTKSIIKCFQIMTVIDLLSQMYSE